MDQYGGPQSIPFGEPLRQDGMNLVQDWTGKNTNNFIEHLLSSMDTEPVVPHLVITEQPKPKDHRFRYPCEGRTAGALLGEKSSERKKTCPEVKVENLTTRALIVGSLVTKEENVKPHPFKLVGANCKDGIVKRVITPKSPKVKFESLGIQCVKKADLKDALMIRKRLQVDPYNNIDQCLQDDMQDLDCKVLRICFQAFLEDPNTGQFTVALTPVLTQNIYNKKDSNLKIMKMNKREGTAKGGDEVFIFCEKVDKEDIEVIFYNEVCNWTDYGVFGSTDVHHQIAIVLKTPPYKVKEIEEEIEVKVRLQRTSDKDVSDAEIFTYIPENADADQIEAKRRRNAPSFEDNFTLTDEASGSSSKLSDVKKKLNEKLKAKERRKSAKNRGQVKPEAPFSFPSADDGSAFILAGSDTTAHVTIDSAKRESSFAMVIPDNFMFPVSNQGHFGMDTNLNMTAAVEMIVPDEPTINLTDVTYFHHEMGNEGQHFSESLSGTVLSAGQLAALLTSPDSTLTQHNNVDITGLPAFDVFMNDISGPQQDDFDMAPPEQ